MEANAAYWPIGIRMHSQTPGTAHSALICTDLLTLTALQNHLCTCHFLSSALPLACPNPHSAPAAPVPWAPPSHYLLTRFRALALFDPAFLLLSQFSEYLPKMPSQLCIQRLPAILGNARRGICTLTCCDLSFHSHPSMELLFVCLAAHDAEFRRWPDGVDRRICQTFAASPAEPGELPLGFRQHKRTPLGGV